jgi:carbonic anhydrase
MWTLQLRRCKSSDDPSGFRIIESLAENIRDVYRLHQAELDSIEDEGKRYDRLVELNVQEQCINVIKMACVQERYILEEHPVVHGWVFDLRTGKIIDLEIDFEKY